MKSYRPCSIAWFDCVWSGRSAALGVARRVVPGSDTAVVRFMLGRAEAARSTTVMHLECSKLVTASCWAAELLACMMVISRMAGMTMSIDEHNLNRLEPLHSIKEKLHPWPETVWVFVTLTVVYLCDMCPRTWCSGHRCRTLWSFAARTCTSTKVSSAEVHDPCSATMLPLFAMKKDDND